MARRPVLVIAAAATGLLVVGATLLGYHAYHSYWNRLPSEAEAAERRAQSYLRDVGPAVRFYRTHYDEQCRSIATLVSLSLVRAAPSDYDFALLGSSCSVVARAVPKRPELRVFVLQKDDRVIPE